MVTLIFLASAIFCLASALWLVRVNRWPRVQVRVLKKWEEITGRDTDNTTTGWLHADIEYWYESQKYSVRWKGDLQENKIFPEALWMVVDPVNPDKPQILASWEISFILLVISCVSFFGFLRSIYFLLFN
jgi:hypothetical protein